MLDRLHPCEMRMPLWSHARWRALTFRRASRFDKEEAQNLMSSPCRRRNSRSPIKVPRDKPRINLRIRLPDRTLTAGIAAKSLRKIREARAAQGSAAMTNQQKSGIGGRRGGGGGGRCRGAVLRRGLEAVRWNSAVGAIQRTDDNLRL
jgi:hypothetical protein